MHKVLPNTSRRILWPQIWWEKHSTAHLNHHCGMVGNWPKTSLYYAGWVLMTLKICSEFNHIMIKLNLNVKFGHPVLELWHSQWYIKNLVNYLWWKSEHPNLTSKRWAETKLVHQVLPNVSMEDTVTSNQARKMFHSPFWSSWRDDQDIPKSSLHYTGRDIATHRVLTPLKICTEFNHITMIRTKSQILMNLAK